MAKAKAKAKKAENKQESQAELQSKLLDPKDIHELLGIYGPYDPPPLPIQTKGYVTFWDPTAAPNGK